MVRWLVMKGAKVTGHELQLAAFGGYHRPGPGIPFFLLDLCFLWENPSKLPCLGDGFKF